MPRYALALALASSSVVGASPPAVDAAHASGAPQASASEDATETESATAEPTTPTDVRPRIAQPIDPLGPTYAGPVPDQEALAEQIDDELDSTWLGATNRRAISIRDALTGESLADRNSGRLVTPASTTKLLAAAAIVTALEGQSRFATRVVTGTEPGEIVIVAGGDMLLADGEGDPEQVAGHAGIAELAAQTAAALAGAEVEEPVTVSLDLSYAAGPSTLDTWTSFWVSEGYTGRIVQLGRSGDRALPFNPSPDQPEQEVARVFRQALAEEGVEVSGTSTDDEEDVQAEEVDAAEDATELAVVESAPVRDVLALALATSDNAMVEQLARQGALADGQEVDQGSVMAWIEQTMVEDYDLDMTGVQIVDASGLSDGTLVPVSVVADVLVAGSDSTNPPLQEVLAAGGLPVAGYTGTLATRFHLDVHAPAVGNARAKTGSLPGVTSLAGTVVTADGRLLVYAITADAIDDGAAALEARSAVDEVVAELARCGC